MHLIINPIGPSIIFDIVAKDGERVSTESISSSGREFEMMPRYIIDTISTHHIDHVILIRGPAPFTRIRILTLIVNTLHFTHPELQISAPDYFEWLHTLGITAPILIRANNREYLIARDGESRFTPGVEIPHGLYQSPGVYEGLDPGVQMRDFSMERGDLSLISHIPRVDLVTPLYIKEPHITCPKS